jgi:hypothetical protein
LTTFESVVYFLAISLSVYVLVKAFLDLASSSCSVLRTG